MLKGDRTAQYTATVSACLAWFEFDIAVWWYDVSGSHTRRPEDACQPTHFDRNTLPFITLVSEYDLTLVDTLSVQMQIWKWRHEFSVWLDW